MEMLFGESKEERGPDHSQLMSTHALVRFWTLAMLASVTRRGSTASRAYRQASPGDQWGRSTRDRASPSSPLACVAA